MISSRTEGWRERERRTSEDEEMARRHLLISPNIEYLCTDEDTTVPRHETK